MAYASVAETSTPFHFETPDLDELSGVISQRIRPCKFLARGRRYHGALRYHRAGGIGFSVIRVNPDLEVAVEPVEDSILFQTALAGGFRARCLGPERFYGEGDVHVVNPASPLRAASYPGTTFLVIRVAKSTLEEHAGVLADTAVDGERLLPEALPSACREAASLRRYLEFLHAESMIPGSALHGGVASRAAEQLLASLIVSVAERVGARARPERAEDRTASGHVRRAEEYIDGHVDDDIGLVDIAGSAGVDARTLDAAFRRRRGAGPLEWLEQRRAERTARELGAASPQGSEPSPDSERSPLTPRELEIARLVAAGFNNLEIANVLEISRNTVKEALKRVFRKIDVDSRAELTLRLSEAHLL
jgi:DNA-binding CsgD family transcriptional regulator